ncbi:hypothetical protein [Amycolatopsis sp. NPDC054798]
MSQSIEEIVAVTGWAGGIQPGRDWSTVEQDIGTMLPDDCKELFSLFPSGAFCDAIVMANPVDARTNYPRFLREDVFGILEILPDEGLEYLTGTGYRPFPGEGGLLPWGGDDIFGWPCEDLPRIFRVPSTHLGNGRWLPHPEYRQAAS